MARKNALSHVVATTQSLSASFSSAPTLVQYLDNISYQIDITTTNSTGTFSVQASNDYSPGGPVESSPPNAGHWIDLNLAGGVPTVAAANDDILISLNQFPFKAVRLHYTSSIAGTGTAGIIINARQLGG